MDLIKNFIISLLSLFVAVSPAVPHITPPPAGGPTKILSNGLPDYHLINTAFIEQAPEKDWGQPWQDACEEAALLTADYYYRHTTPSTEEQKQAILDMLRFEQEQGWPHDANLTQMALIAEKYLGYSARIQENPSVQDIKKSVADNIPVIIPANGKTLFRENHHFKDGGPWYHNLVILGYDDRSEKFIVHDVGTRFGAYFKYSYRLLLDSIHDFPSSDNKTDIDQGQKSILLLIK